MATTWLESSKKPSSSELQHIYRFIASTCVMRYHGAKPELLLLQRPQTDSYPLLWEIPGGCAESADQSLIHTAVRELFEETGLQARRILNTVTMGAQLPPFDIAAHVEDNAEIDANSGVCTFKEGDRIWGKVVFMVDVGDDRSFSLTEHAAARWVTEDQLRAAPVARGRDDGKLRIVCPSNKRTLLEAFRLAEESRAVLERGTQ